MNWTSSYWLRKILSCKTLIRKSVSLNSYWLFQPIGPNFRRSCTMAWKKQSEKSNRLKISRCFDLSKNSGSQIGSYTATFNRISLSVYLLSPSGTRWRKLYLPDEKIAKYSRVILWEARSSFSRRSEGHWSENAQLDNSSTTAGSQDARFPLWSFRISEY